MKRLLVFIAALLGLASAYLRSYEVTPTSPAWSGTVWGGEDYGVAQTIMANFDSVCYCELFAGFVGDTSIHFRADVYDYESGTAMAHTLGGSQGAKKDHDWIRFPLVTISGRKFVRGKTYIVKFTRPGDSIQYYYDANNPYHYGEIKIGGGGWNQAEPVEFCDLACRVYGVLDPVDSTYWGANVYYLPPTVPSRRQWADSLEGKVDWGACYVCWDSIQPRYDSFCFASLDTKLACMDSAYVEPVACLLRCPKWASSRIDTFMVVETLPGDTIDTTWVVDTCVYCPPRNLWVHPDSAAHANHWARFVDTVVDYTDELLAGSNIGGIHTWEIWNEANEGCTLSPSFPPHGWPGYTGWWRRPDTHYTVSSDAHDMCSLYVRLCEVAANTIRSIGGHQDDRILIGAVTHVSYANELKRIVAGKWWVDTCYQVAGSVFWDGVSAHPYQYWRGFSEPLLEQDGADMRAVMRAHEHYDGLLWNTELGWSVQKDSVDTTRTPDTTAANNAAETYATSLAALGSPEGGFDRACWWYSYSKQVCAAWPLLWGVDTVRDTMVFHAYKQSIEQLVGKRFNRRVLFGDERDSSARILEFENPENGRRLWVAWASDLYGTGTPPVAAAVPVRSDRVEWVDCAYHPDPPTGTDLASTSGWYEDSLANRPAYIIEPSTAQLLRPDLVVDSVKYVPADELPGPHSRLTAWITNCGNRATPVGGDPPQPYSTWVVFKRDTATVGEAEYDLVIEQNQQVSVPIAFEEEHVGSHLYSARANPNQLYVERYGLDDNAGYFLKERAE